MAGLYIHIPFCRKKCRTCDFFSIEEKGLIPRYLEALSEEASFYRHQKLNIDTVYIGGGTPSILGSPEIGALFNLARRNFNILPAAEITFEFHPADFESCKIACLKEYGVNRISLGLNRLNPEFISFMGRDNGRCRAEEIVSGIRAAGFDNLNLDFIFGYPGETGNDMERDLTKIINLKPEHISAYILNIPDRIKKDADCRQEDDLISGMYLSVNENLESSGFSQYEISNYSLPGKECAHNMNYWRGGEYTGLGAGASGYSAGNRYTNVKNVEAYIASPGKREMEEDITPELRKTEKIMLSLRLNEGLPEHFLPPEALEKAQEFISEGMLDLSENRYRLTPKGALVSNSVISSLI